MQSLSWNQANNPVLNMSSLDEFAAWQSETSARLGGVSKIKTALPANIFAEVPEHVPWLNERRWRRAFNQRTGPIPMAVDVQRPTAVMLLALFVLMTLSPWLLEARPWVTMSGWMLRRRSPLVRRTRRTLPVIVHIRNHRSGQ
ncbi:MAG: hypothetical protein CM15mP18_4170 [Methanobacteriota archaeon]|nr:MAG: hypothetical protein CM15mP18_4170 [Euryarchaeota archaeon]